LTSNPRWATRSRAPDWAEDPNHDAYFADDDPWQTVRRKLDIVSLEACGGDAEDPNNRFDPDDEGDEPEPDRNEQKAALLRAAAELRASNVLSEEEYDVFSQRSRGHTYATIAAKCRPRLSGPSQARKIESRAVRKIQERLLKLDKSVFSQANPRSGLGRFLQKYNKCNW
jgi:hypothetical protein